MTSQNLYLYIAEQKMFKVYYIISNKLPCCAEQTKSKENISKKTRQYFIGYTAVLLSQVYNSLPSLILVESKRTLDIVKWSPLFAAKCQVRSLSSSSSYRFQSVNHVTLWNVNATGKRFEGGRPRRAIPAKKEREKMDFVFRLSVDIDQLSGFWLSLSLSLICSIAWVCVAIAPGFGR